MAAQPPKTPVEENIQDHKCSVCLELYSVPKVLPCCHTFCLHCLEKIAKTGLISCPKCRATHIIPEVGLGKFLTDFVENYEMEASDLKTGARTSDVCGECETQTVTNGSFCTSCRYFLCVECEQLHKRVRAYRSHEVISHNELSAADLQQPRIYYCSVHTTEPIKLFCETCEKLVCRDCTLVEHRQHSYKFVQDARKEAETKLQSLKLEISRKIVVLESDLGVITSMESSAQGHNQVLQANINEYFDNLVKGIEAQRTALLQEAEAACEKDLKQVWADKEFHEMSLASISTAFSLTDKALKCTNDSEMILTALQSIKQLSLIKEREWDISGFVKMVLSCPSFEKGHNTLDAIGNIVAPIDRELEVSFSTNAPHLGSRFTIKVTCNPIKMLIDERSGSVVEFNSVTPSSPELKVKVLYGKSMKELNNSLVTTVEVLEPTRQKRARTQLATSELPEQNKVYNVTINLVCGGKHTIIFNFGFSEAKHVIMVQGMPQNGCCVSKGPDWKEDDQDKPEGRKFNDNQVGTVSSNYNYQPLFSGMATNAELKAYNNNMVQVTNNYQAHKNYKWGKDEEYEIELYSRLGY